MYNGGVNLVFDSDGMIKLHRAGLLELTLETFHCLVPEAVYQEVVVAGRANNYADAHEITAVLDERTSVVRSSEDALTLPGLGKGERAALALASAETDAIVVSDDRRFLTILTLDDIPYLTPVDVLVVLLKTGAIDQGSADEALERMRPLIRTTAYWETKQEIETGGEGK